MPKTTVTAEATPVADTITVSKSELQALIAAELAKQSLKGSDAGANESRLAEAIDALSANQKAIADQVNARHRTLADMLAEDPKISAFNPKGDRDFPRPTHFRKVNGVPRLVRINGNSQADCIDRMTLEEITAFDSFTESCTCRNGTWKANVFMNGNQEVLDIILPTGDMDKRQEIGSLGLLNILFELRTKGKKLLDTNVLNRILAKAADPDAFIANLERLLATTNVPQTQEQ